MRLGARADRPAGEGALKRLLVLNEYAIGYPSGFGQTLFSLLQEYPGELLWDAHPATAPAPPERRLGTAIPFSLPARPKWWPVRGRLHLLYWPMLKLHQWAAEGREANRLIELIRRERIDALMCSPVNPWTLRIALHVHKVVAGLKLIFFVMDDWEGHHLSYGLPYTQSRRRLLGEMIELAAVRLAVSGEMAGRYRIEFGGDWLVMHNGVDVAGMAGVAMEGLQPKLRKIFLAGDVNVFRHDAVTAFARGLQLYNQDAAEQAELRIQGIVDWEYRHRLEQTGCVKWMERSTHAECLEMMRSADLLYLPLAFEERVQRIAELSLPTKLPEYLASGRPVFFHAPERSAVFQCARRWDLQPRLSVATPEAVCALLRDYVQGRVCYDPARAQAAVRGEFDLVALRRRLYEAIGN